MDPQYSGGQPFMLDPALDVGLLFFRPDGALDFANDRAQALFGCKDRHELEERLDGVRERLTPELKRLAPRSHLQGSLDLETTVEGRPRSLRLELSRVGETGSEGFLAIVTDEDTMRALEIDLRLATHLRAVSRVSRATAHDIRTPLHTVVLYLELLRNTLSGKSQGKSEADTPARQERYVDVIASEIQRLEGMLETLLSQTRLDDKAERFDLLETVRDLHLFMEPYCRRTRVQVHLKPSDAPVVIEGDKDALRHALLHILITAVEGCPAGGEMDLSVATADAKGSVVLRGGPGLSSEILDGSRGAPSTQRAFGPERGLYVARRVVERHGGSIKVRSGAKRAPTLEIQLPLAAAEVG
jgi:signal transduction histidine kinase